MIENEELQQAWDRVARTADGHTIYLHLQKRLLAVVAGADDGTLRQDNGERMFAAKLLGLMAKGIEESAAGLSTRIVTFASAGRVAVSERGRGAGRRVTTDTIVPGYNDQPADAPSNSGGGGT